MGSGVRSVEKGALAGLDVSILAVAMQAKFKSEIFNRVEIEPETFLFRPEIISWLLDEKQDGRTIVLVTASDRQKA